jgi:hypothetical protein
LDDVYHFAIEEQASVSCRIEDPRRPKNIPWPTHECRIDVWTGRLRLVESQIRKDNFQVVRQIAISKEWSRHRFNGTRNDIKKTIALRR